MLVLSRKPGEQIKIGGGITVTVLGVRGGVIKLGIDAPPHHRILRGEIAEWITADDNTPGRISPENEALAV